MPAAAFPPRAKRPPAPDWFAAECAAARVTLIRIIGYVRVFEEKTAKNGKPYRKLTVSWPKASDREQWVRVETTLWEEQALDNGAVLETYANGAWCPVEFDPKTAYLDEWEGNSKIVVPRLWITVQGAGGVPTNQPMERGFPPEDESRYNQEEDGQDPFLPEFDEESDQAAGEEVDPNDL